MFTNYDCCVSFTCFPAFSIDQGQIQLWNKGIHKLMKNDASSKMSFKESFFFWVALKRPFKGFSINYDCELLSWKKWINEETGAQKDLIRLIDRVSFHFINTDIFFWAFTPLWTGHQPHLGLFLMMLRHLFPS